MIRSATSLGLALALVVGTVGADTAPATRVGPTVGTTPTAAAVAPASGEAPTLHAKPHAAGAVAIDAADLATGDDPVTIVVEVAEAMTDASVQVTGSGAVEVLDSRSRLGDGRAFATVLIDDGPTPRTPADLEQAVLADASGSAVTATLRATDGDGVARSASDTVWVERFAGSVLVSESGEQELRLQRIEALERAGTIGAAEAEELVTKVRGGGASVTALVTPGTCAAVCVSGTVRWTDSAGGIHPVDRAPVEIRDQESGRDVVVTTVTTDADGFYSAVIDNDDGDSTGRDLYVRVGASGPGFTLDQFIESPVDVDVPAGSEVTHDLVTNTVDDNNTAFSIHAALVYANDYLVGLRDQRFRAVPVVFPDPDGSFYDGRALHILAPDRWDWDVSLHEYGHFIADVLNIERNPGGPHSGGDNLSDSRGSKRIGIPLAFGEGWPTYFAVSALFETARGAGIPNVGDTKYQDTEDLDITNDLESNRGRLGEDNEVTVMSILWDLFDRRDDGLDTVHLGAQDVWDLLDGGDPHSLSDAYAIFSPNERNRRVNCIFTQFEVSPTVRGRAVQRLARGAASPTIRWERGNGGTHRNDDFRVLYTNAAGRQLFADSVGDTTRYRADDATWASIVDRARGEVRVAVVGTQTDRPVTGPYRSCEKTFLIGGRR